MHSFVASVLEDKVAVGIAEDFLNAIEFGLNWEEGELVGKCLESLAERLAALRDHFLQVGEQFVQANYDAVLGRQELEESVGSVREGLARGTEMLDVRRLEVTERESDLEGALQRLKARSDEVEAAEEAVRQAESLWKTRMVAAGGVGLLAVLA